jgi:hypothetical protein
MIRLFEFLPRLDTDGVGSGTCLPCYYFVEIILVLHAISQKYVCIVIKMENLRLQRLACRIFALETDGFHRGMPGKTG